MRSFVYALAVVSLGASALTAEEKSPVWPQFRGPHASGVAEGSKPPVEFGVDKNVKWAVAAPPGFSSPIVVGEKLVLTAFDDGKLYTIAYDRGDGRELWRAEAPARKIEPHHKTEGSPAASTPASDGTRIVSYFGSCGLFCYDLSGQELWRHELPTAATLFDFGTGVSPIIAEGVVVLQRDEANESMLLALDAATGAPKWKKSRASKASHATPIAWKTSAGTQIVTAGVGRMIGYDLATGEEKWWVNGMPSMCCASPVVGSGNLFLAAWSPGEDFIPPGFDVLLKEAGEEKLGHITRDGLEKTMLKGFFDNQDFNHDEKLTRDEWDAALKYMAGTKNSAFALKPGGAGDVTTSHVLWRKTKGLPYVPSMLFHRDRCYTVRDGGIVTVYDAATGEEVFTKRVAANGRYYSSPVAANGFLYLSSLDEGTVTVLKIDGEKPEVAAKNELGERVAATPAIADDVIYFRTAGKLYAFEEKK